MKRNTILIICLVLCGVMLCFAADPKPDFHSLYAKVTAEIESRSFSPDYVKANMKQIFADTFSTAEKRALSRCRHVLESAVNKNEVRKQEHVENRAFLMNSRKTGLKDAEILTRMQRLTMDTEWVGDPNAFVSK